MNSPASKNDPDPTESINAQAAIDNICDHFEANWREGSRQKIAEFLVAVNEPLRSALLYELILIDIELRRSAGESPTPEEYLADFPNFAATVQPAFDPQSSSRIRRSRTNSAEPLRETTTHAAAQDQEKSRHIGNYKLLQKRNCSQLKN